MNILEYMMNIIETFIIQIYEFLNIEDDFDEELCSCCLCKKNI
jgi:hypothetical protein